MDAPIFRARRNNSAAPCMAARQGCVRGNVPARWSLTWQALPRHRSGRGCDAPPVRARQSQIEARGPVHFLPLCFTPRRTAATSVPPCPCRRASQPAPPRHCLPAPPRPAAEFSFLGVLLHTFPEAPPQPCQGNEAPPRPLRWIE